MHCHHFYKGNKFFDFLSVPLVVIAFIKWGLSIKEFAPRAANSFL